jgi:hypothetical protein
LQGLGVLYTYDDDRIYRSIEEGRLSGCSRTGHRPFRVCSSTIRTSVIRNLRCGLLSIAYSIGAWSRLSQLRGLRVAVAKFQMQIKTPNRVALNKGWGPLIVALAVWLAAEPGQAGSLVEFDNVSEHAKPAQLFGYLARPDGTGPFPAVVVLHGCGGVSSHSIGIADQLSFSGLV